MIRILTLRSGSIRDVDNKESLRHNLASSQIRHREYLKQRARLEVFRTNMFGRWRIMRISLISVLGAVGIAASVILAPLAGAATVSAPTAVQHIKPAPQNCSTTNVGSECISPGNVQINDAPPFVDNFPMYGSFPWFL